MCRWLIAAGKRPVPFRTRKLSPPAPMVLPPGGGGRVGYRRPNNFTPTPATHQPNWCAAGVLYTQPPAPVQATHITHAHRGHCIADTAGTCTLHNADSTCHSDRVWPAPVADSAAPRCGHRRHLRTPHCRHLGVQDGPAPLLQHR